MNGPLTGLRVLEFAGIGPGPHCAMLLADMGADVVRIDRPDAIPDGYYVPGRGRASLTLDLKLKEDLELCRAAVARADVLIEGFRPGVMERLGLGPADALELNARLVYGRMTGWGQSGPLALSAGHDINYIAVSGALAAIGEADRPPPPPLNLVGDFGGGSLYLAMAICAALWERDRSGRGQVIDAAIVDGAANLMASLAGRRAAGTAGERGSYYLDGSVPYYRCYACKDGRFIAFGALEDRFYDTFLQVAGLKGKLPSRKDPGNWPELTGQLETLFASRTRDEWQALFEGTDACVSPVLDLAEAPYHPHNAARENFTTLGMIQPAPAPRFSRTPSTVQGPPAVPGEGGLKRLRDWGAVQAP